MRRMPSVPCPRRRRGFTLVELLVVITIIAVLVGLLLPVIQGVRETGRRTVCQNNQYNLAFAAIRHAEQNGFVPGWKNEVRLTTGGTISRGWPIMVLPFIERTDIWRLATANASTGYPFVSLFVCPSSPTDNQTGPWLAYAGNVGRNPRQSRRFEGVMLDTTVANTGRLAMDKIASADGTSFTCLLSEKCGPGNTVSPLIMATYSETTDPSSDAGGWAYGANGISNIMFSTFGMNAVANANEVPGKIINSSSAQAPGFPSQPSSNHPGGAVAAFCDGHTEFLKESLSPRVYAQLLSWDDANALTASGTNGSYAHWTGGYRRLNEDDYKK